MRSMRRTSAVAILAPVTDPALSGLHISSRFEHFRDGDPDGIEQIIREAITAPGGRVALAVAEGAEVVGFVCLVPPGNGDRFYSLVPAVELRSCEVVPEFRGRGIFSRMFAAAFAEAIESCIVFAVADPGDRQTMETRRAFRRRAETVLGRLGFVPLPTDYQAAHIHRDAAFLVRIGRAVGTADVEDFYRRLRSAMHATVGVALRSSALRNLVRTDLERNGFRVPRVTAGDPIVGTDVVVTDAAGIHGRELTVRVADVIEVFGVNGSMLYPATELEHLPEFLRAELARRRTEHG